MRDQLPEDLDRGFVGVYKFPDNKRRKVTGILYLLVAAVIGTWSVTVSGEPVLVNTGLIVGCIAVGLSLIHI